MAGTNGSGLVRPFSFTSLWTIISMAVLRETRNILNAVVTGSTASGEVVFLLFTTEELAISSALRNPDWKHSPLPSKVLREMLIAFQKAGMVHVGLDQGEEGKHVGLYPIQQVIDSIRDE